MEERAQACEMAITTAASVMSNRSGKILVTNICNVLLLVSLQSGLLNAYLMYVVVFVILLA
jgi:hypothetical protein